LISSETVEEYLKEVGIETIDKKGAFVKNPITMEMCEVPWVRSNYLLMGRKEK
jgi:hypothetical protein